jgi:DNA-binding SARP family transcriptional activator
VDRPVAVDTLIEELWSGEPPAAAMASLLTYVSNLRRVLEPQRPPRAPAVVLRTRAPGYLLDSHRAEVDVRRFSGRATAGHEALARTDPEQAVREFDAALGLWRGPPYAEVRDAGWAAPEIARLEELRLSVIEGRLTGLLELGAHSVAVAELEAHVQVHPLREHGCELLALALYRGGRQAEADAATLWRQALTAADLTSDVDRYPLLIGLATSLYRAGNPHDGLPVFVQAMELTLAQADPDGIDSTWLVTTALAAIGEAAWYPVDYGVIDKQLIDVLQRALLRLTDPLQRALVLSCLAVARYYDDDPAGRAALSDQALILARPTADEVTLSQVLRLRAMALRTPDYPEQHLAATTELLGLPGLAVLH